MQKSNKPPVIIVFGMHRSGTSLTSQLVAKWGAYMGDDLYEADKNNQDGYWENKKLNILNNKILDSLNKNWYNIPFQDELENISANFVKEAEVLINEMDYSNKIWCWKDPRLVILWPFWKQLLQNRQLIGIFTFRKPAEVVNSLAKRDNFSESIALDIWHYYNTQLLSIFHSTPHKIIIDYDSLLYMPHFTCQNLFTFLNHTTKSAKTQEILYQMINSVKPKLNHSTKIKSHLIKSHQQTFKKLNLLSQLNTNQEALTRIFISPLESKIEKQDQTLNEQKAHINQQNSKEVKNEILITNLKNEIELLRNNNQTLSVSLTIEKKQKKKYIYKSNELQFEIKRLNTHLANQDICIQNLSEEIYKYKKSISYKTLSPIHMILKNTTKYISYKISIYKQYKLIKTSSFFDTEWYINQYPDVRNSKKNPALHFILYGANEMRNPGPDFNTEYYTTLYPDVKQSNINPLAHYILYGKKENRKISSKTNIVDIVNIDGLNQSDEANLILIENSNLFDQIFYLEQNPDVKQSNINPIEHYYHWGAYEGRNPNDSFDSIGYINSHPSLKSSKINPLLHYILNSNQTSTKELSFTNTPNETIKNQAQNDHELLSNTELFDMQFYLKDNPDVEEAKVDPINHYLHTGWKEGRNPSKYFDTNFYLSEYPDVKNTETNPLIHYIRYGKQEQRKCTVLYETNTSVEDKFEDANIQKLSFDKNSAKLVAFYLPQFHPIPENDIWWGKGFTEWKNVTKCKPLFENHYQPHLPHDLTYYDLRIPENIKIQIDMAKSFGISAFCFYYYWFDGKRLLETPLDIFLKNKNWDFNFCICWANENWTRRWDGMDQEVLIAQNHSTKDDLAFLEDIDKYISDKRYIRIDNKPLIIIYRPQLFPNIKATVARWRKHYKQKYGGEIVLGMVQTFGKYDPNEFDFDIAIEFPPHNISPSKMTPHFSINNFKGEIYDTKSIIKNAQNKLSKTAYPLFRGVMLNWDNTARKGLAGHIYLNNSPSTYEKWLTEAVNDTRKNAAPEHQFVFINAWNEWAEGTHLEPDQKYGYAYLNATQRVLYQQNKNNRINPSNIIFISHDAFKAGAQLVLLDIVKWFYSNTSISIKVVFTSGGELIDDFKQFSQVHILTKNNEAKELNSIIKGTEELIYMNSAASGVLLPLLKQYNIPIVFHFHELQNSLEEYASGYIQDIISVPNHFIACSKAVEKNLHESFSISKEKISLIHAFVENRIKKPITPTEQNEIKEKLNLPINKKLIYGIGLGLFWRKGVDLFIDLCIEVFKIQPDNSYVFIWIGDCFEMGSNTSYGTWENQIKKIKDHQLDDKLLFFGKKTNVREYLKTGELFVLPSREDPFPLVCLEAADCYLPILCFENAGGMPEMVKNDAGYVLPYEDTTKMAEKTIYLLNNEEERVKRGTTAHKRFKENFSIKPSLSKILETVYKIGKINPLISIIVPNYNYDSYLEERLETIYNQTFNDFEVIILDDCSIDNSRNIIEKYKSYPNTRIYYNDKNTGSVFSQWKKGVSLAKGKLIWIAEADDYSDLHFLERLIPSFYSEETALAYCNSHAVDSANKVSENFYTNCNYYQDMIYKSTRWENDYECNGIEEINNAMAIKSVIVNSSAALMRKSAFLNIDTSVIENLHCSHDWLTYIQVIQNGKINYIADSLNFHRRHKNSVIARNTQNYKKTLEEYYTVHKWISETLDLNESVRKKQQEFVKNKLFPIWSDNISLDKLKAVYPID